MGIAGHRTGGEDTDSGGQLRVPGRGSVWRREDGERGTSKSTGRSERVESSSGGDIGPLDLKKTKWQGHEHLCDPGMPVSKGNFGTDRTTTTMVGSARKQLGTKNIKRREGRQEQNGEVKGRDEGAEELERKILGRSRLQWTGHLEMMADERLPKRAAELREECRR